MQLIITSRNQVHMTVIDYYKDLYHWQSRAGLVVVLTYLSPGFKGLTMSSHDPGSDIYRFFHPNHVDALPNRLIWINMDKHLDNPIFSRIKTNNVLEMFSLWKERKTGTIRYQNDCNCCSCCPFTCLLRYWCLKDSWVVINFSHWYITPAKRGFIFACLFVSLFLCLLAILLRSVLHDLNGIFWIG